MPIKHVNIKVYGIVQGVFFRVHTKEMALKLGLNGFVQNEEDGSVYIEAEGKDDQLDALIAWCRKGPQKASVSTVEVESGELKAFTDFTIRR